MFDYTFQSHEFLVGSTYIFNNPYCLDLDFNVYFFSFVFISKTFKIFSGLTSTVLLLYSINSNILFDVVPLCYSHTYIFTFFDYKYTNLSYFNLLLWKINYYIHADYIIYYINAVFLLMYYLCFRTIFKLVFRVYSYFYNFSLSTLYTFKLNTFLKDALSFNVFESFSILYFFYHSSWILYLEWEYKLLYDFHIERKLRTNILHFVVTYLCAAKYIDVWAESLDLWRFLWRVFFILFYLPFQTMYIFLARLFFYYFDYLGLFKYLFVSISLFYWRFLQNMNVLKADIISSFAFKNLNRLAYLMFFDYHFSVMCFIYAFLPKKFHIQDPTIFRYSYPAIMHPWVKNLLVTIRSDYSYGDKFYNNLYYFLNIFTYISQYIHVLIFSTIQYTFNLLFYALKSNYGFVYILIFQKLRNFLLYLIVLFPHKLNIYLILLFCIYLIFCSSLFFLVFLFCLYFFVRVLKDKLLYLYNVLSFGFIFLGFIVFFPFHVILFIFRLFVFIFVFVITSFFNTFFIFFILFIFLKYDTIFIFEYIWYLVKPLFFDWFLDYLDFCVFPSLLEYYFNWKSFLVDHSDLTINYLRVAACKHNFRLRYYHYYDLLFNSLGFFKWHSIRLWFNNMDYFNRRLDSFYYLRSWYWFYSAYAYLIRGPQSATYYLTNNHLFIFYFYFSTFLNYITYNLCLHLGLVNYLIVRYFLVLRFIDSVPRYYYLYICPTIVWFKSFYYLNALIFTVSNKLIIFCLYIISYISYIYNNYNFDIYSFIYYKCILFSFLFLNIYYFILDIFYFLNHVYLDNSFITLKFIRRACLLADYSSDYFFDFVYSYLRFSRFRLDDFIHVREYFMTKTAWR